MARKRRRFWLYSLLSGGGLAAGIALFAYLQAASEKKIQRWPVFKPEMTEGGCLQLFDDYCAELRSPEHKGNLLVQVGKSYIPLLKGDTRNGFTQAFFEYSRARVLFRNRLPRDLRQNLENEFFFDKLDHLLKRPALSKMTSAQRIGQYRDERLLSSIWDVGIETTTMRRVEKLHPGVSKRRLEDWPFFLRKTYFRMKEGLLAEVSRALWARHPNWLLLRKQFETVQKEMLDWIAVYPRIPSELRESWSERIRSVKLAVPGSDPTNSIVGCSRTEQNAFYFPEKNTVTVCAGDFNTEDSIFTLAHELGHALDVERSIFLFQRNTQIARRMAEFRRVTCEGEKPRCTEWRYFKRHRFGYLEELTRFRPDLVRFQRCLQKEETEEFPGKEYIRSVAEREAEDVLSDAIGADLFIRLTRKRLPDWNGKFFKNPAYLNPCQNFTWRPEEPSLDHEINFLTFFVMEYQCGGGVDRKDHLEQAIDGALDLYEDVLAAVIQMEGEFSLRDRLNLDGYSSSPSESFADWIGSRILARVLDREPDASARMGRFLANVAWLCADRSLRSHFPDDEEVQRRFIPGSHPVTSRRKMDILSEPIRRVLGCEKDFEVEECRMR